MSEPGVSRAGVEEKQKLIDSVLKDLPMPLFLVAEIGFGADASRL